MKYEIPGDMKKTILFFIAILFGVSVAGQLVGDGLTSATAYCGTITNAQSWTLAYSSGTIYVGQIGNEDLIIGTGGSLSVEAGVTVKFCTASSDLIITETGTLTANGNSSSKITFTRNYPSINYWGHISFQSMGSAGASVFDNCIIEYGDVTSFSNGDPHGGGGGIFIDFNDVSITNCTFQHNKAQWGGGIFVYKIRNPHIKNCYFYDNSAKEAGGGIFLWDYASSIIENSIFYSNSCNATSGYSGGGLAALSSCIITVVNCTFVNNTSSITEGQAMMFSYSPASKALNSIFWGSSNQISLASGTGGNTIINCAIQAGVPSGSVNCITLNSSNIATDGPNFNATNGSDWSIKYISPCRDAGTPTGAPLTDYLGNGRVGPYDIGAYEVQYSRWNGSANDNLWSTSSNWDSNLYPGLGTGDIIIPSGLTYYPIGNPSQGYVLGLGKNMILNPGAKATFSSFINNGAVKLESDASGISSFITNTNVTATIDIFLTGGNPGAPTLKLNKWHFISSPISSLPVSTFAPTYTKNVVGWYDNQVSGSLATGWIAYDGYRYSTGAMDGPTFSNLTPGNGYDFYAASDLKYTFSGQINYSNVPMSLSFSVNDALHGFNLLGNPFSSGLNWDDIITNVYFPYPPLTSKSLYFTRDNAQCSYISGVGIPSDVTGIIPPMQGFFVKTYGAGNIITIPAGARVQGTIHARYKGDVIIPLVRLSLAEGTLTDEAVVRFDAAAKSGLDYDFDAPKMFLSPDLLSIYSTSDGSNLAINGLPFPDPSVDIPIVINLTATGTHTITATQLQGLDNYDVTLTDNTTGFVANLKTTPVLTFSGTTGTTANRFIMKVGTITTGIEDRIITKSTFNIYPANNNMINIQTMSDEWDGKTGSVRVLDLSGKTVSDQNNSEFSKNSLIQIESPGAKGIYFVEIKSGVLRYVGKVVIK